MGSKTFFHPRSCSLQGIVFFTGVRPDPVFAGILMSGTVTPGKEFAG